MRALASLIVLAPALLVGVALGEPEAPGAAVGPWRLVYATEISGRRGLDVYVVDVPGGTPASRRRRARPERLLADVRTFPTSTTAPVEGASEGEVEYEMTRDHWERGLVSFLPAL